MRERGPAGLVDGRRAQGSGDPITGSAMDLFWRENKKFVLGVGAALLVGLLVHLFVIGRFREDAATARAENKTIQDQLTKHLETSVQPTDEILDRARGDLERLEKNVRSIIADLALTVPKGFVVPKGERQPTFFFDTQLKNVKDEVRRKAPKAGPEGVRLPPGDQFGFLQAPDPKSAPEYLVRLALLSRLVQSAFDAPVVEIVSLQALPGLAQGAQDAGPNPGLFIQRHTVEIKTRASFGKFLHMLHGLSQKGQFLVVEAVRFAKEDQLAPTGLAEFTASGLNFNPDGSLQGSAPGVEGGGGPRPGGYRPRGRG